MAQGEYCQLSELTHTKKLLPAGVYTTHRCRARHVIFLTSIVNATATGNDGLVSAVVEHTRRETHRFTTVSPPRILRVTLCSLSLCSVPIHLPDRLARARRRGK